MNCKKILLYSTEEDGTHKLVAKTACPTWDEQTRSCRAHGKPGMRARCPKRNCGVLVYPKSAAKFLEDLAKRIEAKPAASNK